MVGLSHGLSGFVSLLRTPLGRQRCLQLAYHSAQPVLSRIAAVHRLTLARQTRVVAVVGSLGKTTTTRAITAALGRKAHRRLALNRGSAVADALLRIRPSDRHAVIEVGIRRPGQMATYAVLLRPNITVVTSIASDHTSMLGTLEATRTEKAEMVRALDASGLAVLNGDDPNVRWMASQTRAAVKTFGFNEGNDVRAVEVALDWPHGTRFALQAGGEMRSARERSLSAVARASNAMQRVRREQGCPLRLSTTPAGAFPGRLSSSGMTSARMMWC